MSNTKSKTNLINDCYLLFGSEIFNSADFLKALSPSELKTAYRKKAFETHPDRAHSLGKDRETLDELFKYVITAYERLCSVVHGEHKYILKDEASKKNNVSRTYRHTQTKQTNATGFSSAGNARKSKRIHKRQKTTSDHFYKGNVPKRKLLIGQYLYYSGLVSWRTLFNAISWQRKQRPIIGKIALDWGILSYDAIQRILTERSGSERFGEHALRNGFITYFEFLSIIGKQKSLQRPIGEYFVKNGFVRSQTIEAMSVKLKKHNREMIKNDSNFF